jgi:hypothetical protein
MYRQEGETAMTGMMMERAGMTPMTAQGMTAPGMTSPMTAPSSWVMVPRCTFKFEKCQGGMKVTCVCDDQMGRSMMQNLCTMLQGGMCSCCAMMNGMMVCCCNLTMGMCKAEMTDKGVCVTCTSGDSKCCEMIQSCCDCLACMSKDGCTCCLMMNNTPVCCG